MYLLFIEIFANFTEALNKYLINSLTMKQLFSLLLLCIPFLIQSQHGFVFAGGDATDASGAVSYSAGQVFFHTFSSGDGALAEGLQQPYEISIVTSIEEGEDIELRFSAYPNPVSDMLYLDVQDAESKDLQYQLLDFNGRILKEAGIEDVQTFISMQALDPAVYFLRITHENNTTKTFRILKTH